MEKDNEQLKELTQRQKERRENKEKLRKHRMKKRLISIGLTIGLVASVMSGYALYKSRTFEHYNILWESEMEHSQKDRCASWEKYVLQYSESGASCINGEGNTLWSISYEMLDPKVSIQGDYALIMDCKGTQFFICNKEKGITGSGKTPFLIVQGEVATQGTAAIVCEKDDISYIYYYKATGDKLDVEVKATMERVGYPLDIAISPDGKSLAVSYLYVEGGGMQNKVVFYDFSNETSETVSGTFSHYANSDTIIPAIVYADKKSVIAVGDNLLTFYKIDDKGKGRIPSIEKEIVIENQIISMFSDNKCIGFVWEEENMKQLTLYNAKGDVILKEEIAFSYDDILYNGTYIVLYNETECIIYSQNGSIKYENTFLNGINQILQGPSANEFYLIMGDTIQKIRLV